jgi:ABC-type cobalt transport system substrate-binding protein
MKIAIVCGFVILLASGMYVGLHISDHKWAGVDESVVEKFAIEANRPPHEPLINIERGDLPLLMFLLAGAAGGFVAGYHFRSLFPNKDKRLAPCNRV